MIKKVIISLIAVSLGVLPIQVYAGKCTGSSNCNACRSCSSCKHCNEGGGTCGVCGGGSEVASTTTRSTNSTSDGKGVSGTTLLVGAGVAGAAYALGRSGKKK
jgi:hypothetical protein